MALTRNPLKLVTGLIALAFCVLLVLLARGKSIPGLGFTGPTYAKPIAHASARPVLEHHQFEWDRGRDSSIVYGSVSNISGESLRSVSVVVNYYDNTGKFLMSDEALIQSNPILAAQTSPYRVATAWNRAMHRVTVDFKEPLRGVIWHSEGH